MRRPRERESGEDLVVAQALLLQAEVLVRRGNPKPAVPLCKQASDRFERAGDRLGVVRALTLVGVALREQGDLNGAEAHYRQALALAQSLGNLSGRRSGKRPIWASSICNWGTCGRPGSR